MNYKSVTVRFRKKATQSPSWPNGRPPEIHSPVDKLEANRHNIHVYMGGRRFSYPRKKVLRVIVVT